MNPLAKLSALSAVGSSAVLGHSQRTKYMKTGDKVVCVDNSPCKICGVKHGYIKNGVYVIKATKKTLDGLGVECIGISRHPNCGSGWTNSLRFRLLDELKEQNANKQQAAQVA